MEGSLPRAPRASAPSPPSSSRPRLARTRSRILSRRRRSPRCAASANAQQPPTPGRSVRSAALEAPRPWRRMHECRNRFDKPPESQVSLTPAGSETTRSFLVTIGAFVRAGLVQLGQVAERRKARHESNHKGEAEWKGEDGPAGTPGAGSARRESSERGHARKPRCGLRPRPAGFAHWPLAVPGLSGGGEVPLFAANVLPLRTGYTSANAR